MSISDETSERLHASKEAYMEADMARLYQRAKKLLIENRECLITIAEMLTHKHVLTGKQVRSLIRCNAA